MTNDDLGVLLAGAGRRIAAEEAPILASHQLSMWEYVVLGRLFIGNARSQLTLAADIRYDKTRLIGLLDALERRDLIVRAPDPTDRRYRSVRLSDAGRAVLAEVRTEIHAMEVRLLDGLDGEQVELVRDTLRRLREG